MVGASLLGATECLAGDIDAWPMLLLLLLVLVLNKVVTPMLCASWWSTGEDLIEAGDPLAKCTLLWPLEELIEFISSSLPEMLPTMNKCVLNRLRLRPWLYDVKKPWLVVVAKDDSLGVWQVLKGAIRALLAWPHCD